MNLKKVLYRKDRVKGLKTKIPKKVIEKNMGWCDDINHKKYNKLIKITKKKINHEKLFRRDYKYDFFIPIKYNFNKQFVFLKR